MMTGLIVVLIGVLFLLKELGYITVVNWGLIWPSLVILLGLVMVARRCKKCGSHWCSSCMGGDQNQTK